MQAFFHPFCPHSLILVQLEQQLVTSLQAAWSRGNIYTLLRFRDLQGWEKAPGTGSSHLIALPVLFPACGTRLSGSRQGNTRLSLAPLQLGLFGVCPSHGEGSLRDCTLQDVVCNVNFQVHVPKGRG